MRSKFLGIIALFFSVAAQGAEVIWDKDDPTLQVYMDIAYDCRLHDELPASVSVLDYMTLLGKKMLKGTKS